MTQYNGKTIFEGTIESGDPCRREYLDSVTRFIDQAYAASEAQRDRFMAEFPAKQADYRQAFLDLIGRPIQPYPTTVPQAKTERIGSDDFGELYRLQIETMPNFWFYGLLMVPHGAVSAPLVVAQHGGGSLPEVCSDLLGESNYGFFTKRALERGMVVFAPQLLLWDFDTENCEKKLRPAIRYDRKELDRKLKHLGLSITGLEVFCIRRSIDYLHTLSCVDPSRTGMMGISYGGYFSLYTAAAEPRIRSVYAAAFFNDRTQIAFEGWRYQNGANQFGDAEVAALIAPRRLQLDVGKTDPVFDYRPALREAERAAAYYARFGASEQLRFTLWEGGHRFDESGAGFDFFFEEI